MGVFRVRVQVFNIQAPEETEELEMVVDTGATYPVIPRAVADQLGIQGVETRTFTLADGTQVSREMGWAGLSYDGRSSPSLVILGGEEDVALLGAVGLETLGFEVNPITQSLKPARQYLLLL